MTFSIVTARSKRELLRESKSTGRPVGRNTGGWVDDLAALGKAITLCRTCKGKFNYAAYGYEKRKLVPMWDEVIGECDGCKETLWCQLFTKRTENGTEKHA